MITALLMAGCGDESGSSAEGPSTASAGVEVETGSLSKAQFIKRADAICQKGDEDREEVINDYTKSFSDAPSQASLSSQAETLFNTILAPVYQKQIDGISALGAPSGDEEEVAAFLTALQQSIDEGAEQPLKFIRSRDPFIEAVKLANAYGFAVCLA